jgi:hypothetical protein
MQNVTNAMYEHQCIMMKLDTFTSLVEKLTNGMKTVAYEFGAYITDSEKTEETKTYEVCEITDLLSEHFGVKVTSWHSDTCDSNPCVWIVWHPEEVTGQLSFEQMKAMQDKDCMVCGVIAVDIHEFINNDLESFLDLISERLTGSPLLSDLDYKILGNKGDDIFLKVTGDASLILDGE